MRGLSAPAPEARAGVTISGGRPRNVAEQARPGFGCFRLLSAQSGSDRADQLGDFGDSEGAGGDEVDH